MENKNLGWYRHVARTENSRRPKKIKTLSPERR